MTINQEELGRIVAGMKAEINELMADGTIPASASSFSELHDYVDANMLAEDHFPGGPEDEDDEAFELRMDAHAEMFNPASDAVDAWLKAGRPAS